MHAEESSELAATADPRGDPRLSLDAARRVDQACAHFERAWQAGRPESIESCLAEAAPRKGTVPFSSDENRDSPPAGLEQTALLRELLALEVEYRLRRGQQPAPEEYLDRFAAHAPIVEMVFRESAEGTPEAAPAFLADHPRYRVLRLLGAGGMGSVYLAEHRALERAVALKVINPELLSDPAAVDRFRSEAKAAACLSHPNVVAVYDAETAGVGHFLVMEYVVGSDLARTVIQRGPLPAALACDYVRQAALGLQHAHQHGMVHRDITPRNLMLTEDGRVKVLDFGLACFVSDSATVDRLAAPGLLLGSIDYMAPEQAVDPHAADIRADIYSLGCTLYFLLTGRPPFPHGTLAEKIAAHAGQSPPPIVGAGDDVPPELSRVLARMLSKSPADRYQTPLEVAAALAPFSGAGAAAMLPDGSVRADRGRRRRGIFVAAALLCGLVLAGWYAGWWPWHRPVVEVEAEPTEAQRLYREGVFLLKQRQEPQMRLAIGRLESAVKLDPQFALAFTALADAYNLCGDYGWEMADGVFPKAKAAARRALAQNDHLAEAHLALAFALDAYDGDAKQAEKEYLRALQLKPQLPAAHHWYAWFLVQQGRPAEAAAHIEQAQKLGADEVIIANNVGKIHYLRRNYPLAVERHKYALELSPDFRKAHLDLGLVYAELGNLEESLREIDQAKGLTEDGRDLASARAYAYARNGRPEQARALLAELEPAADRKPLAYTIAAVYAALGAKDRALAWLDRAFREHSAARTALTVDPRFDGLRTDPRFQALLKRLRPVSPP